MQSVVLNTNDIWSFPELDDAVASQQNNQDEFISGDHVYEYQPPPREADVITPETEQERTRRELQEQQTALAEKTQVMNALIIAMQNPFQQLSEPVQAVMNAVIAKVCKKILTIEIEHNPGLIRQMIDQLVDQLPRHKGLVTVTVSQEDHTRISSLIDNAVYALEADASLTTGDIWIKSNSSSLCAILDERIAKMLRGNDA